MKKCNYLLLLFVFISTIFMPKSAMAGGNIDVTETLAYLNGKFKGKYTFDVKNGKFYMEGFKNGKKVREDKATINDFDRESVKYSEEEKAVIFKCKESEDNCIDRVLYFPEKTHNQYGRINLIVEGMDEKSINGIQKALVHLFRLCQKGSVYISNEPFE